jgi:CHAD domain-containing protein
MNESHKEIELTIRMARLKAAKVLLDADMTAGEAFRTIVTSALQHLFENVEPVLRGEPEGIHQGRVAIRRLRVALSAFKRTLPYEGRKAFNGEFRWLQQRMEPSRDWHVFLHQTLPLVATGREDDPEIRHLRRIARDERRRASREAAKGLTGKRYPRLILHFEHWLTGLSDADNGGGFDQPLAPFAGKVLGKTYRDLSPRHRTLSRMPVAELHAMRIAGKEARYTAEFFQSLYPYPETQRYLEQLNWIQDRLGELNDARVARQILTSVNARRIHPETEQIVRAWSEKRIVQCARAAQPQWRMFVNTTPFWEFHQPGTAEAE